MLKKHNYSTTSIIKPCRWLRYNMECNCVIKRYFCHVACVLFSTIIVYWCLFTCTSKCSWLYLHFSNVWMCWRLAGLFLLMAITYQTPAPAGEPAQPCRRRKVGPVRVEMVCGGGVSWTNVKHYNMSYLQHDPPPPPREYMQAQQDLLYLQYTYESIKHTVLYIQFKIILGTRELSSKLSSYMYYNHFQPLCSASQGDYYLFIANLFTINKTTFKGILYSEELFS
jgi:hypothetical protein